MDDIVVRITAAETGLVEANKQIDRLTAANKKLEDAATSGHEKARGQHKERIDFNTKLSRSFEDLGEGIVAAFAVEKLIEFGVESVKEFGKAEAAANTLKFTLKNMTNEGTKAFDELTEQAENLSKTTYFSPAQLQEAQAQASAFGLNSEQIKKLIPFTTDLATRTGSLSSAMEIQLKAIGINGEAGVTKGLKQYGLAFKSTTDNMDNFNKLLETSTKTMGLAQNAMNSTDGRLKRIAKDYEEAKEAIGGFLVKLITGQKSEAEQSTINIKANKEVANSSQKLLEQYKALSKDGVKPTAEEKVRLTSITDELRAKLGDSVVSIDEETGAFKLNVKAVQDAIAAKNLAADNEATILAVRTVNYEKLEKEAAATAKTEHEALIRAENDLKAHNERTQAERQRAQAIAKEGAEVVEPAKVSEDEQNRIDAERIATEKYNDALHEQNSLYAKKQEQLKALQEAGYSLADAYRLEHAEEVKEAAETANNLLKANEAAALKLRERVNAINMETYNIQLDMQKDHIKAMLSISQEGARRDITDKTQLAMVLEKMQVDADARLDAIDKQKIRRKLQADIEAAKKEFASELDRAEVIEGLTKKAGLELAKIDQKTADSKLILENKLKEEIVKIAKETTAALREEAIKQTEIVLGEKEEGLRHENAMYQINYDKQKNTLDSSLAQKKISQEEYDKSLRELNAKKLEEQAQYDDQADQEQIDAINKKVKINKDAYDKGDISFKEYQENQLKLYDDLTKAENKQAEDAARDQLAIQENAQAIQLASKKEFFNKVKEASEQLKEITDAVLQGLAQSSETNIDVINTQMDRQNAVVDEQKVLAEKGLQNDLAFEEKRADDLTKKKIQEEKKLRNIKELETFLNSVSKFSEDDPKTAIPKALAILAATKATEAVFAEDGGIIGQIGSRSFGMNRRHKSGNDVLLHAEKGEGILSVKEMNNLGANNFGMLKSMLKTPFSEKLIPSASSASVVVQDNSAIVDRLESLENTIKNKKEVTIDFDAMNNMITTEIHNGIKNVTRTMNNRRKI